MIFTYPSFTLFLHYYYHKLKYVYVIHTFSQCLSDGGGSVDAGEIQQMIGGLFTMAGVGLIDLD